MKRLGEFSLTARSAGTDMSGGPRDQLGGGELHKIFQPSI